MNFRFKEVNQVAFQGLCWIVLFFSCVPLVQASTPIYREMPEYAAVALDEFRYWHNQIERALEDEDLPLYWAERGVNAERGINTVFQGYVADAPERTSFLLRKVIDLAAPPAAALYVIASRCNLERFTTWCTQNSVVNRLREADPGNLAVYFADFPRLSMNENLENIKHLDTEENRQRLRQASSATRVDEYFSRDAASWAEFARKANIQIPPPERAREALIEYYKKGIPENQLHGYHRPIEALIWKHNNPGWGGSPLDGLPHLCKLMAHVSDKEAIINCELISDILIFEPTEPDHQYIGRRIKSALASGKDPESPEVVRLEALWMYDTAEDKNERLNCEEPIWRMNGVIPNGGLKDLNLYYRDLQDFSYIVASKNALVREMVAAGLSTSDCRDRDNGIKIMRTYWSDYQPHQNNENQ